MELAAVARAALFIINSLYVIIIKAGLAINFKYFIAEVNGCLLPECLKDEVTKQASSPG